MWLMTHRRQSCEVIWENPLMLKANESRNSRTSLFREKPAATARLPRLPSVSFGCVLRFYAVWTIGDHGEIRKFFFRWKNSLQTCGKIIYTLGDFPASRSWWQEGINFQGLCLFIAINRSCGINKFSVSQRCRGALDFRTCLCLGIDGGTMLVSVQDCNRSRDW